MRLSIDGASCGLQIYNEGCYLLTSLFVDPSQRGEGLASRLIETAKFIARSDGLSIRLWADSTNRCFDQQALYEFYQRHEFHFFDASRPTWMEYRCPNSR